MQQAGDPGNYFLDRRADVKRAVRVGVLVFHVDDEEERLVRLQLDGDRAGIVEVNQHFATWRKTGPSGLRSKLLRESGNPENLSRYFPLSFLKNPSFSSSSSVPSSRNFPRPVSGLAPGFCATMSSVLRSPCWLTRVGNEKLGAMYW